MRNTNRTTTGCLPAPTLASTSTVNCKHRGQCWLDKIKQNNTNMQLTLTQRSSCRACCSIVSQCICFTYSLDQCRRNAAGIPPSGRDILVWPLRKEVQHQSREDTVLMEDSVEMEYEPPHYLNHCWFGSTLIRICHYKNYCLNPPHRASH